MRARRSALAATLSLAALGAAVALGDAPARAAPDGVAAFETVRKVLQHPRCQNCHIPADAPLQFDDGRVHAQNVRRGADGGGALGLRCATCHANENPPASYGVHAPPGAPGWKLPPPETKMVFVGLSSAELATVLKDVKATRGKDLNALLEHVSHDKLVLWGWNPGGNRAPVPVPHEEFTAAFRAWVDAGAPVPPR